MLTWDTWKYTDVLWPPFSHRFWSHRSRYRLSRGRTVPKLCCAFRITWETGNTSDSLSGGGCQALLLSKNNSNNSTSAKYRRNQKEVWSSSHVKVFQFISTKNLVSYSLGRWEGGRWIYALKYCYIFTQRFKNFCRELIIMCLIPCLICKWHSKHSTDLLPSL